jgi:lysophospholipase L1-like esterase
MKNIIKSLIFIVFSVFSLALVAQPCKTIYLEGTVSVPCENMMSPLAEKKSEINTSYPFLNKKSNVIQYKNRSDFVHLIEKWNARERESIVIAHFGDSHIQNGYLVASAREKLQALKGKGGRGMIFPYAIAKTYSQNDYSTTFTGSWVTANSMQYTPKIPLGISGFSAKTSDPYASFSFKFNKPLDSGQKKIRIFLTTSSYDYHIDVSSGENRESIDLKKLLDNNVSYVDLTLPEINDSLSIAFINRSDQPAEITIHGVSIENLETGIVYHGLGVGGAAYNSINSQLLFSQELPLIKPDLIIVDYGTNDTIYKNAIPESLADTVVKTIEKIRATYPQVAILLTSTQDMNFKGKNISAGKEFARLIKRIALENRCLFYDWYQVSGDANAMRDWHAEQLSQADNIHLNIKGYQLKGSLFSDALIGSFEKAGQANEDSLIIEESENKSSILNEKKTTKFRGKNKRIAFKSKKNAHSKIAKVSSANKKKAPKPIKKSVHLKPKARH